MARDSDEPNRLHVVRSNDEPNVWRCGMSVDFSTSEGAELLRGVLSPEGVLFWLNAAFGNCCTELPDHRKILAALEREMRQLLDLTIENLYAHPRAFGIGGQPVDPAAADFRDARDLGDPARLMLHLAVETCHQMLPVDQRGLDSIESQVRSLFEKSLLTWRDEPRPLP